MKTHRTIRFSLLLGLSLSTATLFAQEANKPPIKKLIEKVPGVWKVTEVNDGKKKISQTVDSTAIESIEFTREAKYIIRNKTQQLDSGLYRLNEQQKTLYLESRLSNDTPPAEWSIDVNGNTLTMTGKSSEATKNFKYTLTRISHKAGKEKRTTNDTKGTGKKIH
ncbi:hypothetical protein KK062_13265 [Fulvivirgaceae bacterium PWU5]|uniref:Lipocalin-like domain-containing protein n=1 Tax=Dawidia cretensis TaxID=2782350 RepID=A0AAP2DX33_9BACT|nr:hypothetical protein [Dawidia cretensis]MBT1709205.1 hypothetical protein [Dawidia cretensis]